MIILSSLSWFQWLSSQNVWQNNLCWETNIKALVIQADPAQALSVPVVPLGTLLAAAFPLSSQPPYVLSWLNNLISAEDMMHPELLKKLVLNNFCKFFPVDMIWKITLLQFSGLNCCVYVNMTAWAWVWIFMHVMSGLVFITVLVQTVFFSVEVNYKPHSICYWLSWSFSGRGRFWVYYWYFAVVLPQDQLVVSHPYYL